MQSSRTIFRVLALLCGSLLSSPSAADSVQKGGDQGNIFDPAKAPQITILVKGQKAPPPATRQGASETVVTAESIARNPSATTLQKVVTTSVAGASETPDGEFRVRGSDNQYAYYLDGAPLPLNVSGSFSDQINPKDIETLRVFTGGFPAEYGGQLAAIFDVTAKAGTDGKPAGLLQQLGTSQSGSESSGQFGSGSGRLTYFVSGIHSSTNSRLSPVSQTPLHDAGRESVGFAKLDYQMSASDRLTLDTGLSADRIQIPNEPDRQALGQDDVQSESGAFANLIWRRQRGPNRARLALYSHNSHVRYDGSPADLLPSPGSDDTSDLISTFQDQTSNYLGLRGDYTWQAGRDHKPQIGFDVNRLTGTQDFKIVSPPDSGFDPIVDTGHISGGDRGAFIQDNWTSGRLNADYGIRYDIHQADITTSQFSPRVNLRYRLSNRDTLHAYYDRLFQPIAFEDVKNLIGQSAIGGNETLAPLLPERDNFYELGWERHHRGADFAVNAYYKTSQDIRDDETLGNTQIDVPINEAKAFTKGLEFVVNGPLSKTTSFFLNYSLSYLRASGPIVGGLIGDVTPPGYFIDDLDQTHTATVGLSYQHHGNWGSLIGEYGSGLPYGELDDENGDPIKLNYLRVPSHFIVNTAFGRPLWGGVDIALSVDNIFNRAYIIKQTTAFSEIKWNRGREIGLKLIQRF